jgi:hypothetical protein
MKPGDKVVLSITGARHLCRGSFHSRAYSSKGGGIMKPGDIVKLSMRAKREDCRSGSSLRRDHTARYGNSVGTIVLVHRHSRHRPIVVLWDNTTLQVDCDGLSYDINELEIV